MGERKGGGKEGWAKGMVGKRKGRGMVWGGGTLEEGGEETRCNMRG